MRSGPRLLQVYEVWHPLFSVGDLVSWDEDFGTYEVVSIRDDNHAYRLREVDNTSDEWPDEVIAHETDLWLIRRAVLRPRLPDKPPRKLMV